MSDKEMRELDAWIAVNLFGAKEIVWIGCWAELGSPNEPFSNPGCERVPNYTTDPAAALAVLQKCAEKVERDDISICLRYGAWIVSEWSDRKLEIESHVSLAHCICLFARELFKEDGK